MEYEEALLVRMFFGENDRHGDKPLYKHVVELCRKRGIAGATVFRGLLGYGKSSVIHKVGLLGLSSDLPMLVEIIDCEEKLKQILPELAELLKGGIITVERVKVLKT
ncbi:MAG: DUF190 domain-containing protein [Aquificaceae bacterium]|nr:DUF190 domain-containing protein [Aquificaceae bacterium]MCX8164556.1 DUF190 domain-containing protein [Aquificaceae bacterium]